MNKRVKMVELSTNFAMLSGPDAQVVKLVDTHGSGPCAATHGGSSPFLGTIFFPRFSKS